MINSSLRSSLGRAFGLALIALAGCGSVAAQPAGRADASRAANDLSFGYSHSPAADLERNGRVGEVEINHASFAYARNLPPVGPWRLSAGVFGSDTDLDLSAGIPLPDRLQILGVTVGARRDLADVFGQNWSGMVMLRPYWSADSSSLSNAGFNLPVAASVSFRQSATLAWDFGVAASTEGEHPVLPLVGVRWEFAPKWTASLGFPRTGVAYQASPGWLLRAGATYQGGTYHVAKARAPRLGDTWLDYRDIRVGVGADIQVTDIVSLVVDGGVVVDRSFEYFDRDFEIEGDTASFITVGVRARF